MTCSHSPHCNSSNTCALKREETCANLLCRDISSNSKLNQANVDEDAFANMTALELMYVDYDLFNYTCPGGEEAWTNMFVQLLVQKFEN